MDWLTALPIIFAAVTVLYAAGWVLTRWAGSRSRIPRTRKGSVLGKRAKHEADFGDHGAAEAWRGIAGGADG
jgi:hypothetical protein